MKTIREQRRLSLDNLKKEISRLRSK